MDNNERAIGTIGVRPSIDAIAEVRVLTNEYPAEVGRTAGGVIILLRGLERTILTVRCMSSSGMTSWMRRTSLLAPDRHQNIVRISSG